MNGTGGTREEEATPVGPGCGSDRPLRFCMITTFYPPYNFGGDGVSVHRLANELARRGHQVEVIHCLDAYRLLARREPAGDYQDHPNVTVHGLESGWGALSPLATQQTGYPVFKSAAIQKVLDRGFDVIHYHNVSLVGGPRVLEYGQGIKLYTMREYWLLCPTHVLFRFNRAICTKPTCFLCTLAHGRLPQWWRYSNLLRRAVGQVDAFIAPSRFCKQIHESMGLTAPIVHLPNFAPAVDLAPTYREEPGQGAPAPPYFLFVGRLEKLKGLQTLIPLFQQYRKAELWIAGEGDYEAKLRTLAGNAQNIRFLGRLSEPQLQTLYRQAVAVIVPSVVYEIFGLVIIEAFRQKTPVLARRIGGMPEIIEESGGGVVYDTEEQLLAAMDRLLAEPSYRCELGELGYQAYWKEWTSDVYLRRYLALIDKIAAAHGLTFRGTSSSDADDRAEEHPRWRLGV